MDVEVDRPWECSNLIFRCSTVMHNNRRTRVIAKGGLIGRSAKNNDTSKVILLLLKQKDPRSGAEATEKFMISFSPSRARYPPLSHPV